MLKKHLLRTIIIILVVISIPLQLKTSGYKDGMPTLSKKEIYPPEVHVIQKGDSLWSLSNSYGTTINAIKSANSLTSNIIRTGEEIVIPRRIYYITEQNIFEYVISIDNLLEAIYIAEGGEKSRVPYGATSFYDNGGKFLHARSQDFFDILTKNCSIGSREYYKAASAVTVLYYWEIYMEKNEDLRGAVFDEVPFDKQIDFIHYLGSQYAPVSASHLNENWIKNVVYYFNLINDRSRPLL